MSHWPQGRVSAFYQSGVRSETCVHLSGRACAGMRVIAVLFGPRAPAVLMASVSAFSHDFQRCDRLTKRVTRSIEATPLNGAIACTRAPGASSDTTQRPNIAPLQGCSSPSALAKDESDTTARHYPTSFSSCSPAPRPGARGFLALPQRSGVLPDDRSPSL